MSTSLTWRTQVLRLSFFHDPDGAPRAALWRQLTGEEPETVVEKKREGALIEEGGWNGGLLRVSQENDRTDVILQAIAEPAGLADAGPLSEVAGHFIELAPLTLSRPVLRVAFGAVVHLPTEDRRGAYSALASLLPCVNLSPEASDFAYQINRPIASAVVNVNVNRLSKWAAIAVRVMRANDAKLSIPIQFAALLELDINTAVDSDLGVGTNVPKALLEELVQHGLRIAAEGDQP